VLWLIGALIFTSFAGGFLVAALFQLAGLEGWYEANKWARTVFIAPLQIYVYHKSGVELFGLRRLLGWKHD
jgi:hypothetical protein